MIQRKGHNQFIKKEEKEFKERKKNKWIAMVRVLGREGTNHRKERGKIEEE